MSANKLQYVISLDVFEKESQLTIADKKLLQEAARAAEKAYAPYSKFKVGAAVLLEDGSVFTGNNQENAAYPSGICAERVALFFAMAQTQVKITAIALSCESGTHEPGTPCGACRQAIAEYEQKQESKIRIIMGGPRTHIYIANGIESLLPFMFGAKNLKNTDK